MSDLFYLRKPRMFALCYDVCVSEYNALVHICLYCVQTSSLQWFSSKRHLLSVAMSVWIACGYPHISDFLYHIIFNAVSLVIHGLCKLWSLVIILFHQLLFLSLTDSIQNTMAVPRSVLLILLLVKINIVKALGKESSDYLVDIWIMSLCHGMTSSTK